jgi:hypothetical protein
MNPTPKQWAADYKRRQEVEQLKRVVNLCDVIGIAPDPTMLFSEKSIDIETEEGRARWSKSAEARARARGCTCGPGMLQIDHVVDGTAAVCLFDHDDPKCPLYSKTKSPYHPENFVK